MVFSPAYQSLVILIFFLVLAFVYLLSYTFWTRAKKRYWARYKVKFRDYFLPVLFSFVEEANDPSHADAVIKKLTKRTNDIAFFLELLDEMTEILKGDEREKINWLIGHDLFYRFYREKLFSFSKQNQLLACIYFGKSDTINDQISTRLISLSTSQNTKLAYGASKALQSSEDITIRKNALIRFMKREDASDLMVGELLHLFHRDDMDLHMKIGETLKEILFQKNIPADKKKILILYIAHQNFYEYSYFLLEYLKKLLYGPDKIHLVIGLIKALGQLHVVEAAPVIREYIHVQNVELRLACVEALDHLGGTENLAYLTKLLLDIEFSVRKKIIEILAHHPDIGHQLLNHFLVTHLKFIAQFEKRQELPKDLRVFIQKICSIAIGIKIILSEKVARSQV